MCFCLVRIFKAVILFPYGVYEMYFLISLKLGENDLYTQFHSNYKCIQRHFMAVVL